MDKTKSFNISKSSILKAYKYVKANKGSAGIDEQSIRDFEQNLKDNLYKIWNRMSSGCYFPPAVKAVAIPKGDGGKRILGIPTVSDRVAQTVVKLYIEPKLDRCFHKDSYGYRPGKSAHQALETTRQRCWDLSWVIDLDIKGFFDNMDHELTMKALRHHVSEQWIILYIDRWLKAPIINKDGQKMERHKGTPQGGVISPILANLFMHYTFDLWMTRQYPRNLFARYADDIVIHSQTKREAEKILDALKDRLGECHLELHPAKTKIVYCKDGKRRHDYETISFDFLGYTFLPRFLRTKKGVFFQRFTPAISRGAEKKIKKVIREWKLPSHTGRSLEEIAQYINPQIRGWINYYGKFNRCCLENIAKYIEYKLCRWASRKYKRLKGSREKGRIWLRKIRKRSQEPILAHWEFIF